MKPNPTYFPYQPPSSIRAPNLIRPKLSEQKFTPSMYSSLPMYNSAVTPSVSQNNQPSNYNNHPSGNSALKLFPTIKPIQKQPDTPTQSAQKQFQQQLLGDYFSQMPGTPTSSQTGQLKQFVDEVQKWKNKQNTYKSKIFQLNTDLIVKNSLLLNFQQLIKSESNSQSLVKKLTLELTTSQNQILSLKERLQMSQHYQKQSKVKTQELNKLKQLVQELQSKQLSDLYNSNVPKMNKDKQFYVFKLIECQNTLRQRDLKIAELEKIQKIIIKEMDEIRNKTQVDKTIDIKKYLERQEQLIKSITKYKVDIHNKDLEIKKIKSSLQGQLQIFKKQNVQIKSLFQKNVKDYELQNIQLKQKIKEEQNNIRQLEEELKKANQNENQERVQLLESKLVMVLKQMQITNSEYEQYKFALHEDLEALKNTNYKLSMEIKALKDNKEAKQKIYETLLKEFDILKKGSIETERTLSLANTTVIKRCTEFQSQIKNLKIIIQQKQRQLIETNNILSKNSPQTTDVEIASIRSQNNSLIQKIKTMENKIIEHDFNNKLIHNLETQNKYIKQTVRIQTAEIAFLKKQHLEVIESMINLNQKKLPQQAMVKAQKLGQIIVLLEKYQKLHKQSKLVKLEEILEPLNSIFQSKYSFIKTLSTPQQSTPFRVNQFKTQDNNLQRSHSYQQDMTVNVFYQQHFKGLLMLFDIQDQEGSQTQLNQKIKQLINSNIKLQDESKKQSQKMDIMESNAKLHDSENQKKDKIIQELGKHAAKLQSNVSVAVDKLIKYEILIDDANKTIMQYQLSMFSSKVELISTIESPKIQS